jgi:hypothetical protein
MTIPEWSEVCGHCRGAVAWHDGWAYTPDEAQVKEQYQDLLVRGWPWIPHLLISIAGAIWFMLGGHDTDKHSTSYYIWMSLFAFGLSSFITALPIYVFRWVFVRIKYRPTVD